MTENLSYEITDKTSMMADDFFINQCILASEGASVCSQNLGITVHRWYDGWWVLPNNFPIQGIDIKYIGLEFFSPSELTEFLRGKYYLGKPIQVKLNFS